MVIVGFAILIVLIVCAIHSYSQMDVPREPFEFHIDIDEE